MTQNAQNTHTERTATDKRAAAWLQAKQMIVEQEFDTSDMLMLVKAISPKNPLNTCSMGYESITMDLTGEKRLVPSFTLDIYLPTRECAKMLSVCMTGNTLNLPFKADISFDKAADGLPGYVMKIKSRGEFTPRGVRGMIHTINVEQYAKYTMFRSLNNFLAKSAVYAFDNQQPPEKTLFPTRLPIGALKEKSMADQIVLAEKVFIAPAKEIDTMLADGLTTIDLLDLKNEFVRGVEQTPRELLQHASSIVIKTSIPAENPTIANTTPVLRKRG